MSIRKTRFNYDTESWETQQFTLPWANGDHVLLTPKDLLTRDETWISRRSMLSDFHRIPASISDGQLRASVSNYFLSVLKKRPGKHATQKEQDQAAADTIDHFPELLDYFIRLKELDGDKAKSVSEERVRITKLIFDLLVRALQKTLGQTQFYQTGSTYEEAHQRVQFLRDAIENKGVHSSSGVRKAC